VARRKRPLKAGEARPAETTDKTIRIVWFDGRPYGVTNEPPSGVANGPYWYIRLEEGWHPLFERASGDREGWSDVERRVLDWLAERGRPAG